VINYKVLAFYPLFILEKVLSEFSPDHVGLERANQFRDEMLELGVVDFILECLAHFTHQSSRFLRLRSKNMVLPKYTVKLQTAIDLYN
jgi:hypothetical protein